MPGDKDAKLSDDKEFKALDLKIIIPWWNPLVGLQWQQRMKLVLPWPPRRLGHDFQTVINKLKGVYSKAYLQEDEESTVREPLELLHMAYLTCFSREYKQGKKYCLVVTDACSKFQFGWFFLANKDEYHRNQERILLAELTAQNGVANQENHKEKVTDWMFDLACLPPIMIYSTSVPPEWNPRKVSQLLEMKVGLKREEGTASIHAKKHQVHGSMNRLTTIHMKKDIVAWALDKNSVIKKDRRDIL
ncbi:hypothetical protein Tco_1032908 [Tanacetum coccineum]|uniref:Uncharacterized protein n=1 Tax=Tanacetum coccineum TaxID=301880 RepID=A0ABQ5GD51_9ASTR